MSEENTNKKHAKDKNWFARHRALSVIGVLVILAILGSALNKAPTSTPTADTSTPQAETKPQPAPEPKKPDVPIEYVSALAQANTYANAMHMSKQGVYDQLVSEYGGKFSKEAAQYGMDNVKADWNANALASAKTYQNTMHLSPAAVRDQLVSEYGAKFTASEADYAIAHLND